MERLKEELLTQIYYYCCSYPHYQAIIFDASTKPNCFC
jgi:hypothetical protein